MKRGIIFITLAIFFCSFASAEIIFTEPIDGIYNLGEVVNFPVTIETFSNKPGMFQMDLICNGTAINFYKEPTPSLYSGKKNIQLPLIQDMIGNKKGICKVKAMLNGEYNLSNEFEISDLLVIDSTLSKTEFNPEEKILITGKVSRENGEKSNGFVEARIVSNNYNVVKEVTITNGNFEVELTILEEMKEGDYILKLTTEERDSDGITTNYGEYEYNIKINQVPKNLELIFEDSEILPEESIKVKAILHDQTGELIDSSVYLTIKNSKDKILEQKEFLTGELLEYRIPRGEIPSEWKVFAMSNKISTEKKFSILEKESADISIINRTIYAENTGNVLYNKTILIQIENESLNLQVKLKVGESKKYVLKAPKGEYNVRIASEGKEISEVMSLTGNAIAISETFDYKSINFYLWIIMISSLVVVMFISWNKVYKKSFLRKMKFGKEKREKEIPIIGEDKSRKANVAEISLDIKGEKQDATFVCVKIKNLNEAKAKRGSGYETIGKMKELGEEKKATVYEDKDYLFFILAPAKTRTFKNEQTALDLAEKIQEILSDHNRRFNEKIQYGISIEKGAIVGKIENGIFKFMSMGPAISSARKIASIANEKILLSEKINDVLRLVAKTEKESKDGTTAFALTKIKKENQEARDFINKFMERQKRD